MTLTEAAVLCLLTVEGEQSGYELLKMAARGVGHVWAPAKSQLYAVLPRLVDAGLARRRNVRQQGRPDKQLYRPTPAGRVAVREWLDAAPAKTWDELLLKVFFAKLGSRAALRRQLEEHRELQQAQLDEYRTIKPKTRHGAITLRFGLMLMPVRLAWIEHALQELSR